MVELSVRKEIIQGCKHRENTLAANSLILHMMSLLGLIYYCYAVNVYIY